MAAAAMLDRVDVVREILAAHPEARNALGPHTIPLRARVEAGGATNVLALLDS